MTHESTINHKANTHINSRDFPDTLTNAPESALSITIKNGVATMSGHTETVSESTMAEQLVSRMHGVQQVINLTTSR